MRVFVFLLLGLWGGKGRGQFSITGTGSGNTYTQNFDAFRGTAATLPTYWSVSSATYNSTYPILTAGAASPTVANASGNNCYAGKASSSSSDYAILQKQTTSGSTTFTFSSANNTGSTITGFVITWNVEQYSSQGRPTTVDFAYRINSGTYSTTGVLGTTLFTATTGNSATFSVNQTNRSITISGLSIATLSTADFQFTITNGVGSGSNAHIGIDDFTMYATGPTSSITLSPTTQNFSAFCNTSAYTASLVYTTSGTVTAPFLQLSNSSGSFLSGTTNIGNTVTGSGPYTITGSIPVNTTMGTYRLRIVSTDATPVISSDNGSDIIINALPAITSGPDNTSVLDGSSTTISLTGVTGTTTYQWQYSDDGGSSWQNASTTPPYSGDQTATLSISNSTGLTGNRYRCNLTGSCGATTSDTAVLTVYTTAYIWTNPITGIKPSTANPFVSGDQKNTFLTVSGISAGSGIISNDGTNRYNFNNWNVAALDVNKYFSFTLTPAGSYKIDFTNFVYTSQRSSTGPTNFSLRSSLDGYSSDIALPPLTGGVFSLSSASFQNITTAITFRIYAWGASAAPGTFSINDFTFNGSVSPACPLPSAPVSNANVSPQITGVNPACFAANWSTIGGATGYYLDASLYPAFATASSLATDLFISEYVEGSSNNKYIEIYNGTGSSVNLANYNLRLFSNGASTPNQDIPLTGSLPNGSTIVYKNSAATPYTGTSTSNMAVNFNGNDAVALYKTSTSKYVDIFGRIGENPGTSWTTGSNTTVGKTLIRKPTVTGGITTNPASGFPTLDPEWFQYEIDDVSHLGFHTYTGTSSPSFVTGYNNKSEGIVTNDNVTGLSINTNYYYRVRASNLCGTSINSNVVAVTTTDQTTSDYRSKTSGNYNDPATWEYSAGCTSWLAASLAPGIGNNVIIMPTHTVTLTANAAIPVAKTLTINSTGYLALNGYTLTDSGTISGTGYIKGSGTSGIVVNGSGAFGTLYFDPSTDATTNVLKNLTINRTSGTVTLGNKLYITDVLTATDGNLNTTDTLVLRSTSIPTTARVAPVGLNASITGKVTVERFIPGRRSFRFLAPGVTTASSIRNNWMEGGLSMSYASNVNPKPGFGTHITGSIISTSQFDYTRTGNPSLYAYNKNAQRFDSLLNTSDFLNALRPYRLLVRGSRSTDLSLNAPSPSNTILRATGTLITQPVTFDVSGPNPLIKDSINAFSFIPNPYASPVTWNSLIRTSLYSTYFIWDPNLNLRGGYANYNGTNNQHIPPESQINDNIQPGQAFFVQKDSLIPAPSLQFTETSKTANPYTSVFKETSAMPKLTLSLLLDTLGNYSSTADGLIAIFDSSYSLSVGNDDSYKLYNPDENMAINRNGRILSIEGRPIIVQTDTIPLQIWQYRRRNYYLKFVPINWQADLTAYLQDSYLKDEKPIDLNKPTLIPFSINTDTASYASNRFMIVFRPSVTLPLRLTSVKAWQKDKGIEVNWATQSEAGVDHYEVEKSTDGLHFLKVTATAAKGNNAATQSYAWFDENVQPGSIYYKIKVINTSGAYLYSQVVRVEIGSGSPGIAIYPNPSTGNVIGVQFSNMAGGRYSVVLYNHLGQKLYTGQIEHNGGSAAYTLPVGAVVSKGTYKLQVSNGNNVMNKTLICQ